LAYARKLRRLRPRRCKDREQGRDGTRAWPRVVPC
jgi:hypothetical protein